MVIASVLIRPTTPPKLKGSELMDSPRPHQTTLAELLEWREAGSLQLSPKFQRRKVWSPTQRSYFIDTILQQMPCPQIYLRNIYDVDTRKVLHQVVDGQQRLSSVLDFHDGRFTISNNLEATYRGKKFEQLSRQQQTTIMKYKFNCESFDNISDREVYEVFRRMNTYSSPLTKQELRHGQWFGHFSRTCESLAMDYLEFWQANKILSAIKIARMQEVLITSQLLIAGIDGMQDKNDSIDAFYKDYDKQFPGKQRCEQRFRATMESIHNTFPDGMADSQFRKPPFFYTLFCVLYHRAFGLPDIRIKTPKKLKGGDLEALREASGYLSAIITKARAHQQLSQTSAKRPYPTKYENFVVACLSQTDNLQPRKTRFEALYREAFL